MHILARFSRSGHHFSKQRAKQRRSSVRSNVRFPHQTTQRAHRAVPHRGDGDILGPLSDAKTRGVHRRAKEREFGCRFRRLHFGSYENFPAKAQVRECEKTCMGTRAGGPAPATPRPFVPIPWARVLTRMPVPFSGRAPTWLGMVKTRACARRCPCGRSLSIKLYLIEHHNDDKRPHTRPRYFTRSHELARGTRMMLHGNATHRERWTGCSTKVAFARQENEGYGIVCENAKM